MLLNAFCWALGSVYVRRNPMEVSLPMGVGLQNLSAGLLLMPVCALTIPPSIPIYPSMPTIVAILYLIAFGTLLAAPCYLYVLRHLPVSVSSTFAYITPVITVLVGWLLLREPLTQTTVLGMSVILTGVIVVQWLNRPRGAASQSLLLQPAIDTSETTAAANLEDKAIACTALIRERLPSPGLRGDKLQTVERIDNARRNWE